MKYNYIKNVQLEHPDLDVIELQDGTVVCVNDELVCLYKNMVNFHATNPIECITRPNTKKFLCFWGDGYSQEGLSEIYDLKTTIRNFSPEYHKQIKDLMFGESFSIKDITSVMSILRTK